ncbi:Tetratricopeptide TPR_2 repeat protein [Psychromonas ingrahamii 37]|uniref:Tetratricopeptide TPR_2 repeat protein n=1 Tax=Psychromonas ingrahamii (strain DSM 17664 / CCUG 51855 / 37) TaxID=357804 RepID=A1SS18_PSYIN|nr:tetratricopeptide repeat protein [Psychromonas ingrahamii]ABM02283.1 Tetratricopeptide TPR_2 repeat protein [Psychromonas ingrahamii 37]
MKLKFFNLQIDKALTISMLVTTIFLSACGESKEVQKSTNKDAYLAQGQSYLDAYQFKAAFSAANDAIKIDPTSIDGYLIITKINQESGQPLESVKLLESFTGIKDVEYYFALLDAYQQSGKVISAQSLIEHQTEILQNKPQHLQFVKAQQLLLSNNLQQAKIAFTESLKNPDYKIKSMLALAKIEAVSDNHSAALTTLDEIIKSEPKNTEALFLKSMIYIKTGDLTNAEKSLSEALSVLPTSDIFTYQRIQIIQSLANVLTQQGRGSEALIYTRILSEEFPLAESVSMQYTRALELFENQQFSTAKKVLLEILDNNPGHKKSATLLALIFYNEGNSESAGKYLTDIIDPEISPIKLTELYMATQLQQNKSEEVLNLLKNIPEKNRNVDTWVLYANAAIQQKEFTKAKMALDKAKLLAPQSIRLALTENFYYNSLPEPQAEKALASIYVVLSSHPENNTLQMLYLRQLLTFKKFTEADKYVANLKSMYSENTDTQLIVANYYIYQNKSGEARKIIEKILALENNHLQALYSLVQINKIEKKWLSTLDNYKQIISYYPTEITSYTGIVRSLIDQQKDPLKAANYLPKNYEASLLALTLATLTLQQNKLDLATGYAKEAGNELPQKYQASLNQLTVQLNLLKASKAFAENDYPKAKEILIAALKQEPENITLLSLLTDIEIRSEQYIEARKITDKIAKILPKSSLATRLYAGIFVAQEKPQQAINLLTAYWQKTKDEQVADQLYLLLGNNNSEKAAAFLNEWQQAFPKSLTAIRYQAIYLQNNGKKEQALQVYQAQLKQTPNDVVSLNNSAWLYFEQGNPIAITLAEKAYKLMPENAAILDTYGWILYKNGERQQGKKLIEEAMRLSPNEPEIKSHLLEINNQ